MFGIEAKICVVAGCVICERSSLRTNEELTVHRNYGRVLDKSSVEDFHIWRRGGRLVVVLVWQSVEVVHSAINSQDLKWKSTNSENAEIGTIRAAKS